MNTSQQPALYFTDVFGVSEQALEDYGAFNIDAAHGKLTGCAQGKLTSW